MTLCLIEVLGASKYSRGSTIGNGRSTHSRGASRDKLPSLELCGRQQNAASDAQCPAVTATQAVAVAASATSAARLSGGRRLTCRRCFRDDLEITRMPLFVWLGA